MRERPILFSAPMVRAILAGTKTQTRRVMKLSPGVAPVPGRVECDCPYGQPGDHLWVRETWSTHACFDSIAPRDLTARSIHYWADGECVTGKKRASLHMPRALSRITLEVAGVRVERLHDISEADALAEGCTADTSWSTPWWQGYRDDGDGFLMHQQWQGNEPPDWMVEPKPMRPLDHLNRSARDNYRTLWIGLNGLESWDANPYVWVVEFKRVRAALAERGGA